ncbi:MAG: hypothetical protein ACW986_06635 [Promethearchaeota archaeon]|jgi:hypothetical protein
MFFLIIDGWGRGLSATGCSLFAFFLGIGIMIQARKLKAKLLFYMGLTIFIVGFFWLASFIDFMTVLITGVNVPNTYGWIGIMSYLAVPFVTLISLYIGAKLMIPDKTKFVVIPFFILALIFEILILVNPLGNFSFIYPGSPGENLVRYDTESGSPANLLIYVFEFASLIFCGFGYLYKSFKSKDVIKRKFLLLSVGYFVFIGGVSANALLYYVGIDIHILFTRLLIICSFFFFYGGLKETPVSKKKEKQQKKDIKIEESLFRLYERPDQITEEEITFHREKKICLVCKGKVSGVNYICPSCNALYCINCSKELSNLENVCWVCNEPIDEAKPTKPYVKPKDDTTDRKFEEN